MAEIQLKSYDFRREREEAWREFETLIARAEKSGVSRLSPAEQARLPELYRATVSSLSVARSISLDRNLLDYLEGLAQRGYFVVYGTKTTLFQILVEFFTRSFPRSVRALWKENLLAALVFTFGFLVAYNLVLGDEERFYSFMDEAMAQGRDPSASRQDLEEAIYGEEVDAEALTIFSAMLFQNNAGVGILAFALGLLVGIPSILLLLQNGFIIGAFVAIHTKQGLTADISAWLLIHGVTEITAIIMSAGAGFAMAKAILFPGPYRRIDSLRFSGRVAGELILGCVFMFVIAGIIEGIFRQTIQSMTGRFVFAGVTFVLWGAYFGFAGRDRR